MTKVLIVAYYWPPSGGSGVQRWVKFVKYLPEYDIEPHVYTPLNPDFPIQDDSLSSEIPSEAVIIKKKIIELYSLYRFFAGKKNTKNANFGMSKSKSNSLKNKIAIWVRGNILIPDPRILWVRPSYKFLKKYIKENGITHIVTTGPPHSMHLIGNKLKNHFRDSLFWIADFRDPWSQVYYKDDLRQSNWAKKRIFKLEKKVILNCDEFITVSTYIMDEFNQLHGTQKGSVIYNGYDKSDFKNVQFTKKNKFIISHIGKLPHFSNPKNLWVAIRQLINEQPNLKDNLVLRFVGTVDEEVRQSIIGSSLMKYCEFTGVVDHLTAIKYMYECDILLLAIPNVSNSKGILTGKIFEYLATKRTILGFGDKNGEVNKILNKTKSGTLFGYDDETHDLFSFLLQKYDTFLNNNIEETEINISDYSRHKLTKKLTQLINKN